MWVTKFINSSSLEREAGTFSKVLNSCNWNLKLESSFRKTVNFVLRDAKEISKLNLKTFNIKWRADELAWTNWWKWILIEGGSYLKRYEVWRGTKQIFEDAWYEE